MVMVIVMVVVLLFLLLVVVRRRRPPRLVSVPPPRVRAVRGAGSVLRPIFVVAVPVPPNVWTWESVNAISIVTIRPMSSVLWVRHVRELSNAPVSFVRRFVVPRYR